MQIRFFLVEILGREIPSRDFPAIRKVMGRSQLTRLNYYATREFINVASCRNDSI